MIGFETQTSGFGATALSTEPQPLSKIKGEMHKWPDNNWQSLIRDFSRCNCGGLINYHALSQHFSTNKLWLV